MFLDEIGDISYPLQAKLLQVLQDGEFSRLGGKSDVQVDVRLVAATNRDLETAVASGQFREDLYFRLNVVTINVPPLRERREEIPILTDYFLKKYCVQYNKAPVSISSELASQFMTYDWPGNIRQLENLIKRMVVLGSESAIFREVQPSPVVVPPRPSSPPPAARPFVAAPPSPFDRRPDCQEPGRGPAVMPPPAAAAVDGRAPGPNGASVHRTVSVEAVGAAVTATAAGNVSLKAIARTAAREAEKELILRMLTRTRWNRKEAAENLGISYKALLYKIKENGLDKAS
jgi:DNA-binding NtrC family response regulator